MRGTETIGLETASLIHSEIQQRLKNPTVAYLYNDYVDRGILLTLGEIIDPLSEKEQKPIIQTLHTHVTKEKPLFVYSIGRSIGFEEHKTKIMSASIDLLWSLALMYDDIIDGDTQRAGLASSWFVFGKDLTIQSARAGLDRVLTVLGNEFGPSTKRECESYVQKGLLSLSHHQSLNLDSPMPEIIENYIARADFHSAFPVETMWVDTDEEKKQLAIQSLREVNLAGQVLNDLKDLFSQYRWIRPGFSDIRTGLVTVPVKIAWEVMDTEHRRKFRSLFGQPQLTPENGSFLEELFKTSPVLPRVANYVSELYLSSLWKFGQVVQQRQMSEWFRQWIEYKSDQISEICQQ